MKYLSGDFIALYNRALEEYKLEQEKVDNRWSKVINDIVAVETKRLEDTVSRNFKIGDKVTDTNGIVGIVKDTLIVLNVNEDEGYYGKKYGPNKFFAIKNSADEEAVTCEGMLRMVEIQIESSEIEKDWGHKTKRVRYYEDELKIQVD